MKEIWVDLTQYDKNILLTALENGADAVLLSKGHSQEVKKLGRIKTIAEDGDLVLGRDVIFYDIKEGQDQDEIVKICQNKKVILNCDDWTIIPAENLLAQNAQIVLKANGIEQAKTAFGILEKGADYILYKPSDISDLKNVLKGLKATQEQLSLSEVSILQIKALGMGDRVCIDTCTLMTQGQGMLVGSVSEALFLVHAECIENPYVSPRPFRVNAGSVYAYIKVLDNKTKYLSEIKSGDSILISDHKGRSCPAIVGRAKIERRPLMLVEAEYKDRIISTIVQNAETIRLTNQKGAAVSVVNLKKNDKVLAYIEKGARHFGHKIEETIIEK